MDTETASLSVVRPPRTGNILHCTVSCRHGETWFPITERSWRTDRQAVANLAVKQLAHHFGCACRPDLQDTPA